MCPRPANKGSETSYSLSSLPIILAFNLNNGGQANESSPLNTSVLNINDHLALDQYLDALTNVDRNSSNSMTNTNSTIDVSVRSLSRRESRPNCESYTVNPYRESHCVVSLISPSAHSINLFLFSLQSSQNTIFGYPMPVDLFSAFFATSVTAGGVIGYLKAGSKPSLFAGLLFGGLLGVGTYMTSVDRNNYYLTLGTSTVLATVMGTRFVRSGKLD